MPHIVKVFYNNGEEVRKFQFNFEERYAALQRKVCTAFQREGLVLYWRDHEGDLIRISNDSDLDLMLAEQSAGLEQSGSSEVKLYVLPPATTGTSASSSSSVDHSDATATDETVHVGVECDACNTKPIHGNRFKCVECPNFDLCDACFQRGEHSHHNMILMRRQPPPFPLPFFMRGGAPWSRGGWRPGCPRGRASGHCPRSGGACPPSGGACRPPFAGPCHPPFAGGCPRFSGPCPSGPKTARTEKPSQESCKPQDTPADSGVPQSNNTNYSGEEMGWSFVENMFNALGAMSGIGGAPSAPAGTPGQPTETSSLPEHVAASLNVMLQMGYTDENGWLSHMLLRHNGDISQCLDEIKQNRGPAV